MSLETLMSAWGLPAVFAGTIVEGEGVAFLGGALAHRGMFSYEAAALAATAGAFVVDQAMFHIGRHSARFAFARRMLARPVAKDLLARLGQRPLLSCLGMRFVFGMKTLGALALGASGIAPATYLALDLISAAVWAHAVTALGFGAGQTIETMFGRLSLHSHLAIAVVVVVLAMGLAELARRCHTRR
ncbi:MAG TPA: VTT domain-containing protein [Albidovulum sp.]|uniref:DedA family protein n=1 Tax=Albidovulum sp. TaxID=1872424 RepID=UPI002CA9DD59|nr:VTT domain-containing protein [Albidovulum sp.]